MMFPGVLNGDQVIKNMQIFHPYIYFVASKVPVTYVGTFKRDHFTMFPLKKWKFSTYMRFNVQMLTPCFGIFVDILKFLRFIVIDFLNVLSKNQLCLNFIYQSKNISQISTISTRYWNFCSSPKLGEQYERWMRQTNGIYVIINYTKKNNFKTSRSQLFT